MQNRVPVKREERPPLPAFTPVPRRNNRHDGWTPERQRAFIEALADTGSVTRAAAQVNIAQANCYALRRAPGAESFRAAWEAALDYGVLRLKDIAFERAIEGQLVPVFVAGKLMGFRRKRNDALLMFCLRHYGQDATGKRTTINYFSTRASAGGDGDARAEAQTTTVRTTITGDGGPARIAGAAHASSAASIDAGGLAGRDAEEDDPDAPFVRVPPGAIEWRGELEPAVALEEWVPFVEDELPWEQVGAEAGGTRAELAVKAKPGKSKRVPG